MPLSDLLATTDPMRLHWYSGLLSETFVLRQGKHAFAIISLYLVKGIVLCSLLKLIIHFESKSSGQLF